MPRSSSFSDQIRDCVERSGMTRYTISLETGIDQATLSRFMHRKGGLSMEGLDSIARCIGMKAVLQERARRVSPDCKKTVGKGR